MARKVLAIIAILLCTTVGWTFLGGSIVARTDSAASSLGDRVGSSWGKPQTQTPPAATATHQVPRVIEEKTNGVTVTKTVNETVTDTLPIEQTRAAVKLDLEQRQKGLLWFATYRVAFNGEYVFRNTSPGDQITLRLLFPLSDAIYDDVVFRVDGKTVPVTMAGNAVTAAVTRAPGSLIHLSVGYRSQGLATWNYSFGESVTQVHDVVLTMTTNFRAIDFPAGTLSPSEKKENGPGWLLTWRYNNLVTGSGIGMVMPEKLQPGPLASRISFFAPVSLLFFFFAIFMIATLRRIALHPMHYFFLATSFFAFHLLLAYLADHISIHLAFVICSAVSLFLVISYLRIVVGPRFAFVEAGLAQLVYLVGFSYAFFFQGFTGLAVTIGAILSLFLVMQMTARVDWSANAAAVGE
ncbi:MAG: hypothetical protein QOK37_3281 [Thermoanaerobaculia bacterium]|jgi:inner membrane protein involved in colicin E2 resistance|nr:hypothetical protein [Thermoanaerobaculia bacterium]